MTLLVGTPDIASTTQPPLSATLIYTRPYQRGDRLGMGSVALTYDWALGEWQRDGEALDLVAARFGQSDPAPPEIRILFVIGAGSTAQGTTLTLAPIENAPGVLDLTKPLHVAQWVTGTAYQSLQAQMQDAIADLNAFTVAGSAVAGDMAAAVAGLSGVLADIEQYAGGIERRDSLAEIDAAPDGLYRNIGETGGPIYERKNGATTPRPDLKGATTAQVQAVQAVAQPLTFPTQAEMLAATNTETRQIAGGRGGGVYTLLPPGDASPANGLDVVTRADGRKLRLTNAATDATVLHAGADPSGILESSASLNNALYNGVGELGRATYWVNQAVQLRRGRPARGAGQQNTTIKAAPETAGAVVQTDEATADNNYDQHGEQISSLTIDMVGSGAAIGLHSRGSHRVYRDVTIAGNGSGDGQVFDGSYNYCNESHNVSARDCWNGVHYGNGTPSGAVFFGERLVRWGGTLYNNQHNVYIARSAWFIEHHGVSSDYPRGAHILVAHGAQFIAFGGHFEGLPHGQPDGAWLVDSLTPNSDFGLMIFQGVHFARGVVTRTTTFSQMCGPNITGGTLLFRDCVDVETGERIHRVVTAWQPPAVINVSQVYFNNTFAELEVVLDVELNATGVTAAYTGPGGGTFDEVGRIVAPPGLTGPMWTQLSFTVPAKSEFKVVAAGCNLQTPRYRLR